jgi:S-sulfo-L-cysteine synthase (O-acetyl-L-serine-dependent)
MESATWAVAAPPLGDKQPGDNLHSITNLVGNTPLIKIARLSARLGVAIYAKAEWHNPGGSIKDRAALSMILDGEQRGVLTAEKTILDATSGNTGIAYAWIGAARGYRVKLCLPKNASPERKRILQAYGAELVLTSPYEGSDGAIREARRLYQENPAQYFYPDQYNNPANWRAHYETTAPEIWQQTAGQLTHFVAGLGTSGTFMGTARRLRELNPAIRLVAVQPDGPLHGLEGMKHMATAIVPGIYDPQLADEQLSMATETAYQMVRYLAREEGLLVGVSAGANVAACAQLAAREGAGIFVTVLCDDGNKYLSEKFWEADY